MVRSAKLRGTRWGLAAPWSGSWRSWAMRSPVGPQLLPCHRPGATTGASPSVWELFPAADRRAGLCLRQGPPGLAKGDSVLGDGQF